MLKNEGQMVVHIFENNTKRVWQEKIVIMCMWNHAAHISSEIRRLPHKSYHSLCERGIEKAL